MWEVHAFNLWRGGAGPRDRQQKAHAGVVLSCSSGNDRFASARQATSGEIRAPEPDVPMQLRDPRFLWLTVATVALVVVAAGLPYGIPVYRQWSALDQIERYRGFEIAGVRPVGPKWLRQCVGEHGARVATSEA